MALIVKICLLGDGKVGKTSLSNRYLGKGFCSDYAPTLGAGFTSKQVFLETDYGKKEIRFQIWDLAGQPAFSAIRSIYFQGATGACLVFDRTQPDSLESIKKWSDEYLKHCGVSNTTIIVLGNKSDLADEIGVSRQSVDYYIKSRLSKLDRVDKQIEYFETSAKTGQNVDQAFELLGRRITNKFFE
jgi:small GTP-binding protein